MSSGELEVGQLQGMFIDGPQVGGQPSIEVDERVVAERLHEDRVSIGLECPGHLLEGLLQLQMVQDADAADQVEGPVGKVEIFGIHGAEVNR